MTEAEAVLWAYGEHVKSIAVIYFATHASADPTALDALNTRLTQARERRDAALAAINGIHSE